MSKDLRPKIKLSFAFALLGLFLLFSACRKKQTTEIGSTFIFNVVDTSSTTDSLIIPSGGEYAFRTLFLEGDNIKVEWKQQSAAAKGNPSFLVYLPIKGRADHGILWLNHESRDANPFIGNGGGATVMEISCDKEGNWTKIGVPYAINFDSVGGTISNSLGMLTPWGTILSGEGFAPKSEEELNLARSESAVVDSNAKISNPSWRNLGFVLEFDPLRQEVLGKRKAMGRFSHADIVAMPDGRTCYMVGNDLPSAFFKFVADTIQNFNSGQLFAWKMEADSTGQHWLPLARSQDTLLHAQEYAFRMGATLFNRFGSIIQLKDGSFLLSEIGMDSSNLGAAIQLGAQVPKFLESAHLGNNIYRDLGGRILRYDPKTEKMEVFLESGSGTEDRSIVFSNPGALCIDEARNMLLIFEDNPIEKNASMTNEIYYLELNNANPKADDLKRFAVLPRGARPTGPAFSKDFSALFLNIQIPKGALQAKVSSTIVISGFPKE